MTTIAPRPVREAENRLERFNGERDALVDQVVRRVVDAHLATARARPEASLEYVLNEVAYSEIRRLEDGGHGKATRWRELAQRLHRMSDGDKRAELERLVRGHAADIVGNFNPRVYRFANEILPPALSVLFAPMSSLRDGLDALGSFAGRIRVEGPLAAVRAACDRGTLIVAPTHSSHMDSILLAFAMRRAALPPVTYGAGKNLFSNPFISYFMHNLGAYKVDRRLRYGLYKDVLKEYSTVLLERGYHSLFFPGGTRSRSNLVEQHLKLGLLGTGLGAFARGAARRIYVVPATINYRLVLEAETLVDDYLAETGKSRYIIEDDEFTRVGRILEFVRKILAHEGAVVVRLGQPLDPFGNPVDHAGESHDRRGRPIDPASYLTGPDGAVTRDDQRDAVYTRGLGAELGRSFRRETVFLSTHLVCRALYDAIVEQSGQRDVYRLLRLGPDDVRVPLAEVERRVDRLRRRVAEQPAAGRVDERLAEQDARAVTADALRVLASYHTRPVAERVGDEVRVPSMKLCFYYRNRTAHLEDER